MNDSNTNMNDLPKITKLETYRAVGTSGDLAVIIWFENNTALRYVWKDADRVYEQTYVDGVVHDDMELLAIDHRSELAEYALVTIGEYVNEYKDNPEACKKDWSHIYDMLTYHQ